MIYSIFKTRWGWFGLLGNEKGLVGACLPLDAREDVVSYLLKDGCQSARPIKTFGQSQERVAAYFEGQCVDFSDVAVDLSGFEPFELAVLLTLRGIPYGQTSDYTDLAIRSSRPRAVRAVANAVGKNPLPLIIPCHRVLRKDGSLGGFSAPGGIHTKKRLLDWETR
ncbi:MAG: methylated-DNA--[protein]-cysteine S-methyltransferase [Phycisphaerae bacterium]|nr:methylated-DNA--[protein]-cysteine S-methyltransferase [Phycisphaerae bacterium]